MGLAIWILLIALDLAYELFGVLRDRRDVKRLWQNAPPEPLTYYVCELMHAYWPAKLMLIILWTWVGFHFWGP